MSFLIGLLVFVLLVNAVFRLYGRQILAFAQRRLLRMMESQMKKQSQQFQQNYGEQGAQQRNVYVDDDIRVSENRQHAQREVSEDDIAEDVEFEEIKRS